jgi:hypothetical protein
MRGFVALLMAVASSLPLVALAVPLSPAEIEQLCSNADDEAQCGRLIEEVQLKRLPGLAQRKGNVLLVSLYPAGTATFTDSDDSAGGRAYSLWDSIDPMNAVVLYTTQGDTTTFTVLQRTNGRQVELPSEPVASPDRQHLATADFCASRCVNELAVWRVTRDGIRKELAWSPKEAWSTASATWKDADTLLIEYTVDEQERTLQRKLSDPSWNRVPAR